MGSVGSGQGLTTRTWGHGAAKGLNMRELRTRREDVNDKGLEEHEGWRWVGNKKARGRRPFFGGGLVFARCLLGGLQIPNTNITTRFSDLPALPIYDQMYTM